MTIEQCYQEMGGNYTEVCGRLPSQRLVEKFVRKFLDDRSYAELTAAMAAGDHDVAFRAAHTLKGVCANLGLERLRASAGTLTETLRLQAAAIPSEAAAQLEQIHADYRLTVDTIREFLASEA